MKYIQLKISMILVALTFLGCSEDYFDVNTPSGTATEEQLEMGDLLAPVIHSFMEGTYSAEQSFGNYTQYFVSQGGGAVGRTEAAGLWSEIYLKVLPNAKIIKEKAAENGATHYDAVANILMAAAIGLATDTWDDIPYTEASQGPENNFPNFDSQEEIYQSIFALLDNAIASLSQPDQSPFNLSKGDLIYGGDSDKWLRAAYTLKARYQLHLVNKGIVSANEVVSTIENGFISNSDDFQMSYDDKNINPWYSVEILARNTGNFHHDIASQLVSSMNGDYFPFVDSSIEIDPRLPVFATNEGEDEWKGFVSGGSGESPDGSDANTFFVAEGYYTRIDAPLVLITYAEAKFIEAEARFLANGGTTTSTGTTAEAYNAYLEGIEASMDKYDVDGSEYVNDGSISVGADNLRLEHIMKEKYIHNFLNPETFSDFRRYDFSDNVFRGLTIRIDSDDVEEDFAGKWFRRAEYPTTEQNRNSDVVTPLFESAVTPVWWDE